MKSLNETTFAQCARNSHVFPLGTHGKCPKCGDRQLSPFALKLDASATFMLALTFALGDVLGRLEHYRSWTKEHAAELAALNLCIDPIEGETSCMKHAKRLLAWGMNGQTPCEHVGCTTPVKWPGAPLCEAHHAEATTAADVAMLTSDGA